MAFKYNVNGVGLDAIFDPYISGVKAALTGYTVNGVDLRDIFAPLYLGTSAAITHYKVNNADLNTIFAAKGTARYALPIDGQTFQGNSSGNVSSAMLASVTANVKADGTYSVVCVGNNITTATALGTWLPAGESASGYQVQFVVVQQSQDTTGPATFSNSAAAYTTCSADQSVSGSAIVGQLTAQARGGHYTIAINIKKISTGTVTTSTIVAIIDSVGTG